MNGDKQCERTARDSIAVVIDKLAEQLASMSNDTLQRVNNKLVSVARSSTPTVEYCFKPPQAEQYPPLFESLRSSLKTIERNLSQVTECLDRVEL